MNKIELSITGLAPTNSPQYIIVLREIKGWRQLPIVIGTAEAHAIAVALEKFSSSRPMTHDLFVNTMSAFGVTIKEVVITKVDKGIFYSEIICENTATNIVTSIDSRTSDAIALAVRYDCKIYAYESVLEKAAINVKKIKEKNPEEKLKELSEKMQKAVENENYELAAELKKEIQEIKNNNEPKN